MMKNLFDIFREKLSGAEFPGKEKHWKELEKRLNANDASKGAGFFPTWLVFSILIGLGGFILLFPSLMSEKNETFFNPFNSNTNQVIAHNSQKLETNEKSTDENPEPENLNPPIVQTPASAPIVNDNPPPAKPVNKNASFVRIAIPSGGYATTKDFNESSLISATSSNYGSSQSFISGNDESATLAANSQAASSLSLAALNRSSITDLVSIASLPFDVVNPESNGHPFLSQKRDEPDYFSKGGIGFKVGLFAGLQYSNPSMNAQRTSDATLAERFKKEERGMISPSAAFDFQISKWGWNFSTGINYFTQGEQRNYSNDFVQTAGRDSFFYSPTFKTNLQFDTTYISIVQQQNVWVMTDTTVTYYNEQTGTFVTASVPMMVMVNNGTDTSYSAVVDTTFITVQDSILNGTWVTRNFRGENENFKALLKGKNTYSYFEIPLMIGYDWRIKNLSLGLKAGVGIGRLIKQTAYYLSSDERQIEPYLIEQNQQMVYNLIVKPSVGYWFGKHWGLECSPLMRMNLNSFGSNPAGRNSYRNFGLQGGVNYRW